MKIRFHAPTTLLLISSMAMTTMVSGCTTSPYSSPQEQAQNACQAFGPKTLSGLAIGGATGAASGAAIGAIAGGGQGAGIGAAAGLLTGLLAGGIIGNQMDKRDCSQAQIALEQIRYKQIGEPSSWTNPATGSFGSYTPLTAELSQPNGQFCRKVRQATTLQGHQQTVQDELTCRDANGNYTTIQANVASNAQQMPS